MYGLLTLEDDTKFKIRLDVKPVQDTHMIYESWGRQDYTPPGFTIENQYRVIDIGAHIGAFTVFAAKQAGRGQVYAYEPYPENFRLLEGNIALNSLQNVQAFELGVGAQNEETNLYIDETNNAGHSMFINGTATKMRTVLLSSIFEDNKLDYCDFLKMDCEGAEYEILFNTPKKYLDKIGAIVVEYHDRLYEGKTVEDLQRLLKANNFTVGLRKPEGSQGFLDAKK